jgi:hypothetical protein
MVGTRGNVFVSDTGHGQVKEILAANGYVGQLPVGRGGFTEGAAQAQGPALKSCQTINRRSIGELLNTISPSECENYLTSSGYVCM